METGLRAWVLRALAFVASRGPLWPLGVAIRWIWVFYLELSRDMAFVRAAGMAYATLVALVPGLAVVLWVLHATGASDDPNGTVGTVLDRVFGAVPGLSDDLVTLLAAVDLQALGLAGVVTLIVVASRLYLMVERAYSDVFGAPVWRRPLGLRLLSFYFTITAIPVVLVVAVRSTFRLVQEMGVPMVGSDAVAAGLQFAVLVLALKLLPATTVRWRPAVLGATVSFVLIEVGRRGFGLYLLWVMDAATMSAVYGSLAVLPVFLLWIYLLWVFVLLGVEVAQVSQNYATLVEKELELADPGTNWPSVETALRVTAWVGWCYEAGIAPADEAALADRSGLDARDLNRVLEVLDGAGITVRAEGGWLLARPARAIRLSELAALWRERTGVGPADDPLASELSRALALDGTLADGIARWLPAVGPTPKAAPAVG